MLSTRSVDVSLARRFNAGKEVKELFASRSAA